MPKNSAQSAAKMAFGYLWLRKRIDRQKWWQTTRLPFWQEWQKMFDDFSYLYEHRYTWDAYLTYFGICLWVAAVRVAIAGLIFLLIGIAISPLLAFYFGIDLFHSQRKDEQKRVKRARRAHNKDSKTDAYIKKLDLAAAKRK